MTAPSRTRRQFLAAAGAAGLTVAAGSPAYSSETAAKPGAAAEPEVTPTEDLMREHGVLRRVLLIYDEAAARLTAAQELPPEVVARAAGIVRRFIQDYHEKLEEDQLFPRFEKAGQLVDLVKVLREQHAAGRRVTDRITGLANAEALKDIQQRRDLAEALRRFNRIYRPHAAREDTVLFPAIHRIVKAAEYDAMGDAFEDKERELFGPNGFEKMVDEVAGLEKRLGIYDLAKFTPTA